MQIQFDGALDVAIAGELAAIGGGNAFLPVGTNDKPHETELSKMRLCPTPPCLPLPAEMKFPSQLMEALSLELFSLLEQNYLFWRCLCL